MGVPPSTIEMESPRSHNDEARDIGVVAHCPHCGAPIIRVPMLRCLDCARPHILRAFTYRSRDGHLIAECLDLDLLTQGATEEEAISKLQVAMHGYLGQAFAGTTHGLVPRPAPFGHWVRYYLRRAPGLVARAFARHLVPATSGGAGYRQCHS